MPSHRGRHQKFIGSIKGAYVEISAALISSGVNAKRACHRDNVMTAPIIYQNTCIKPPNGNMHVGPVIEASASHRRSSSRHKVGDRRRYQVALGSLKSPRSFVPESRRAKISPSGKYIWRYGSGSKHLGPENQSSISLLSSAASSSTHWSGGAQAEMAQACM